MKMDPSGDSCGKEEFREAEWITLHFVSSAQGELSRKFGKTPAVTNTWAVLSPSLITSSLPFLFCLNHAGASSVVGSCTLAASTLLAPRLSHSSPRFPDTLCKEMAMLR